MSRSKKKYAAGGVTTATSEKDDKKIWHRAFRHKNKAMLSMVNSYEDNDEIEFVAIREISDPWLMDKDGKYLYFTELGVRKKVDSLLDEVNNGSSKFKIHYMQRYLYDELCEFMKTNKIKVGKISDDDVNRFIQYLLDKHKRK